MGRASPYHPASTGLTYRIVLDWIDPIADQEDIPCALNLTLNPPFRPRVAARRVAKTLCSNPPMEPVSWPTSPIRAHWQKLALSFCRMRADYFISIKNWRYASPRRALRPLPSTILAGPQV